MRPGRSHTLPDDLVCINHPPIAHESSTCASYPWRLVNIISLSMGQVGSLLALLSLYFFLAAFSSDSEWLLGAGKTQYVPSYGS